MASVLIVYGTTEGQTAKIAQHMAARMTELQHQATTVLAGEAGDLNPADFDGVIVGASMHEGRYQREVRRFIEANLKALQAVCSAFFSVSLGAASADEQEHARVEKTLQTFCSRCGWTPNATCSIAGALRYTQYNWLKRQLMRHIVAKEDGPTDTSQDVEFTDWDEVTRFTDEFLQALQ